MIIIFTGGTRSGKSAAAERYAIQRGKPVVYLATTDPGDDPEMIERIALHQARRPASWQTVEALQGLAAVVELHEPETIILLESLTLLVSNLLYTHQEDPWSAIERELAELLHIVRERQLTLIVVTSEVGLGNVPLDALSRRYNDLLGQAGQWLAAQAHEVYLVVMGIPVELRNLAAGWSH
jgi:adenosylcobinamide kinase/adenosylcobinamide-phosphate guanylyltransferase